MAPGLGMGVFATFLKTCGILLVIISRLSPEHFASVFPWNTLSSFQLNVQIFLRVMETFSRLKYRLPGFLRCGDAVGCVLAAPRPPSSCWRCRCALSPGGGRPGCFPAPGLTFWGLSSSPRPSPPCSRVAVAAGLFLLWVCTGPFHPPLPGFHHSACDSCWNDSLTCFNSPRN